MIIRSEFRNPDGKYMKGKKKKRNENACGNCMPGNVVWP
jgi:hypothetical protein